MCQCAVAPTTFSELSADDRHAIGRSIEHDEGRHPYRILLRPELLPFKVEQVLKRKRSHEWTAIMTKFLEAGIEPRSEMFGEYLRTGVEPDIGAIREAIEANRTIEAELAARALALDGSAICDEPRAIESPRKPTGIGPVGQVGMNPTEDVRPADDPVGLPVIVLAWILGIITALVFFSAFPGLAR